jgi:hypothetical protein
LTIRKSAQKRLRHNSAIIDAGCHSVAARLNFNGWHAAITTGNAPDIDVIATVEDHPVRPRVVGGGVGI